jgi:hypothetical protein
MYKPAKHVSFDADKREDAQMMVNINAVAICLGQDVTGAARTLLTLAAIDMVRMYGADQDLARKRMWPR